MKKSNYDEEMDMAEDASNLAPFLFGMAVGVGCAALYAMGRNRYFGDTVAGGIASFENTAKKTGSRVVSVAGRARKAVASRMASNGQKTATKSESTKKAAGGAKRSRKRAAGKLVLKKAS